MSNVWRIGTDYGGIPVYEVFKKRGIVFAGGEDDDGTPERAQEMINGEVQTDDIIAIANGYNIIGIGQVKGVIQLAEKHQDLVEQFGNLKALELKPSPLWKDENTKSLYEYPVRKQLCRVKDNSHSNAINKIFRDYLKDKMKDEIQALLEANLQIILTGAPGTGKTHLAWQIAAKMLGLTDAKELESPNERFKFVQFHPAYDYTDFVEGLKPVKASNSTNNSIGFERRDGVFMDFCKNAAKLGRQPCVFVIDEINRADLSRVFGELFFALEPGYRGKPVETQYASLREASEEKHFSVPKNVFIIGTMNDIDRSIESIDFALRRRFAWYEVRADATRFDAVIQPDLDEKIRAEARKRYTTLNNKIEETEGLGHSYQIGPAYYRKLSEYAATEQVWENFWEWHLKLLLREYVRGWPKPKADKKIIEFRDAYDLRPEVQGQP